MARMLATEWSQHEVRYVLASGGGGKLRIESVGAQPIESDEAGNVADVSQVLANVVASFKAARMTTLIGIDRASIELLHMQLPPASDNELPVIVANQAQRESAAFNDGSVVDFVPDELVAGEPRNVTAAVMAAGRLAGINGTCESAGLTPTKMLLRPYASASLFLQLNDNKDERCLLVNLVNDEADLTVVDGGKLAFSRTIRLPDPADSEACYERVFTEIPRTLMLAPQHDNRSDAVQSVVVFGNAGDHQPLIERLRGELKSDVQHFDAFGALDADNNSVLDDSGRFVPLLGMLLDEARGQRHAIDFLNPRRKREPPNRKRMLATIGGPVAAVVLGLVYFVWGGLAEAEEEIATLNDQYKELAETVKSTEKNRLLAEAIANWENGNIDWLGEIHELSREFPSSRDVLVLRMSMSSSRDGTGSITLDGLARQQSVVRQMEDRIRDKNHESQTRHVQEQQPDGSYSWRFSTTVRVAPSSEDEESKQKNAAPSKGEKS